MLATQPRCVGRRPARPRAAPRDDDPVAASSHRAASPALPAYRTRGSTALPGLIARRADLRPQGAKPAAARSAPPLRRPPPAAEARHRAVARPCDASRPQPARAAPWPRLDASRARPVHPANRAAWRGRASLRSAGDAGRAPRPAPPDRATSQAARLAPPAAARDPWRRRARAAAKRAPRKGCRTPWRSPLPTARDAACTGSAERGLGWPPARALAGLPAATAASRPQPTARRPDCRAAPAPSSQPAPAAHREHARQRARAARAALLREAFSGTAPPHAARRPPDLQAPPAWMAPSAEHAGGSATSRRHARRQSTPAKKGPRASKCDRDGTPPHYNSQRRALAEVPRAC